MLIYLGIYSILALIGLRAWSRQGTVVLSGVIGLCLLLFMGTRYETGCDFGGYLLRFNFLDENAVWWSFLTSEELGFHFLNVFIKKLELDYVWLNVAASLIYLVCVLYFSRLSPKPLLLVALFFPILIVQLGMSGLRQALAVGFMLLALIEYTKSRRLGTVLWVLVAAQFHASAYIFLPLSYLAGKQVSIKRIAGALIFLGPVAAYLLGERMEVYSDRYIEQIYGENSSAGAVFRYALAMIPAILFELYREKVRRFFPVSFWLMRIFSLITFALGPVALISTVALHRLTFYVLPVSLLMLINVAMLIPKRRRASNKLLFFPILVVGIYMGGWFFLSGHAASCYIPYQTYLWN